LSDSEKKGVKTTVKRRKEESKGNQEAASSYPSTDSRNKAVVLTPFFSLSLKELLLNSL